MFKVNWKRNRELATKPIEQGQHQSLNFLGGQIFQIVLHNRNKNVFVLNADEFLEWQRGQAKLYQR